MSSRFDRWRSAAEVRSHRKAQLKYEDTPKEIQKRENRNKARYQEEKAGKVHKHDGVDIGHKSGNALNNSPKNWIVENRHKNRSYKRTKKAHKQDPSS